jgi:hypothetical protein
MKTFEKYKQNLKYTYGDKGLEIYSYGTLVAYYDEKIDPNALIQPKYYSQTTQKHINYAVKYFNFKLIQLF